MSRKILLVEDEALIAMAEAQVLKKYGYEVLTAHNGEKAIETVDSEPGVSLILMDIDLGKGIDGTETAERILAAHDLPIAFLSSHTEPEVVEKTEGITSYGYILKNSGETVLLASVRMAFRLYEAHMQLKSQKVNLDTTLRSYERAAAELENKNEELERYFASSLDMLCIANTEGRFIRVNPEWEKVLGYSVGELEGRSFLDFVHPEDRTATWEAVAKLETGEDVPSFENRLRSRDGSYRWIEWRSRPMDSTIYAAARDITDRKRAQHELEAREENLRITLGSIGDAVISTDTEGTITRINPVAESLCGWDIGTARGKAMTEVFRIVDADTGEKMETPVAKVLETGEIIALANHTMLISRDGTKYQIADSAAPIRDDCGLTSGVVLVFRDVTAEYRVAQALADSERDMARAQAMALLGSWRIDLTSGIVTGSDQACAIYGVEASELSLEFVQSLPLPEYRPELDAALEALVTDGTPYDVEFQIRRPRDDGVRWIHSLAEYDGEHHRIVGTIQDVTDRKEMEAALRENELHFRTLADSGQALVWTSGVDKECNYFNQPWLEFTGRTLEQELGSGWIEGVHPEDRSRCIQTYVDAFDRREPFSMSYRLGRLDGEYRWIQDDGTPRYDSRGEFLGYIGHCLDITDLKNAEEATRSEHARFAMIAETSPVGITTLNEDGNITYANSAAERILGLPKGKIASRTYHEPTWESTDLEGRPLPEERYPFNLVKSTGRSVHGIEHSIVRPEGTRVDLSINGNPIFDEDGEFRGMVATIEDISERKRAEDKLERKTELLENISSNMLDLIAVTDRHGTYTFVSKSHRVLGYEIGDLLGRSAFDFIHPEDVTRIETSFKETIESDDPQRRAEFRYRCANGTYVWVETVGRKLPGEDGAVKELLFSSRDITERKRHEDRLRKIIDHSPLLIHEVAASGHYLMVNDATCALLGMTREELVGKHFDELLPADIASTFKERVDHVTRTWEQMTVDDTLHIDGRERIFRSELFPIDRHDDSPPSVVAMAFELTEEIRLHKEKDLLMREVNHRVKNSLNMVSSLVKLKESQSDSDLSNVKNQIDTISLLHEKLYQTESVTEICLKSYIGTLLSSIVSFSARRVRIEQDIDEICLPPQQAMTLGLIINEIATNAIKHGFNDTQEPILSVKIHEDRKNSRYRITISNTGKPFPEEIGLDNPQTLGLKLISSLTTQLSGTIELQRTPHPLFTITFPAGE